MTPILADQFAELFPIKSPFAAQISQQFGSNGFIPDILPNLLPNTNHISLYAYYGWLGHPAIDFATATGTNIFMPFKGKIWKFKNYGGNQQMPWSISVISDEEKELDGQKIRAKVNYVHVESCVFNDEDSVDEGIKIGTTGNTGYPNYSSAPHCHYEHEPQYFNPVTGLWVSDTLNGYNGCVRPIFDSYVVDITRFEGHIVKSRTSPKCYWVEGGKKRWYPNQISFWLQGKAFAEDVWTLQDREVALVPSGENMPDVPEAVKREVKKLYPNLLL